MIGKSSATTISGRQTHHNGARASVCASANPADLRHVCVDCGAHSGLVERDWWIGGRGLVTFSECADRRACARRVAAGLRAVG